MNTSFSMKHVDENMLCYIVLLIVFVLYMTYSCRSRHRYAYEGFGADSVAEKAQTLDACKQACDGTAGCVGYMFNPSSNKCTTKTAFVTGSGSLLPGTTTYYLNTLTAPYDTTRTYTGTANTTYDTSGLMAPAFTDSEPNCRLACQNVSGCIGYVYDTAGTPPCSLHQSWGLNSPLATATTYLGSNAGIPLPRQYIAIPNIQYT